MRRLSIAVVATFLLAGVPSWTHGQQRLEPQRVEPQRVEPQRVDPQRVDPRRQAAPQRPAAQAPSPNEQRLKDELARLSAALRAEQGRRAELQTQVEGLRGQAQQQGARIASLEAENRRLRALLDRERAARDAAVEDLGRRLAEANTRNERLRKDLSDAQGQVGTAVGERNQLRNQALGSEQDLRENRLKLADAERRLADAERRLADANRRLDVLARELADARQGFARVLEQRWLWAALAVALALAVGSLLTRWLWQKKVPRPVSVSVRLGDWRFARGGEAAAGAAHIALRAVVLPVRAEIRRGERLLA